MLRFLELYRYWRWKALGLLLLLELAPFWALSWFTQPFYDDYMEAVRVREHGLLGAQVDLYQQMTGRFTTSWLLTAANPLTYNWVGGIKLAPAIGLGLLTALLYWGLRLLAQALPRQWALGGALAALLLYLCVMADPYEGIYWFTGGVVYQTGNLALGVVLLASAQSRRSAHQGRWWGVAALATVAAASSNEIALSQLFLGLLLLTGASLLDKNAPIRSRWWLSLGALGAVVAAISLGAPGNIHRMSALAPSTRFQLWFSIWHTLLAVVELITRPGVLLALATILAGSAAMVRSNYLRNSLQRGQVHPAAAGLLWLLLLGSGIFPFWWLWGGTAPVRAENAIIFGALGSLPLLVQGSANWYVARGGPRPAWAGQGLVAAAAVLLLLGLRTRPYAAWQQLLGNARPYEQQMAARAARLTQAQRQPTGLVRLPPVRLPKPRAIFMHSADLDTLPQTELNRVTAAYFDVGAIVLDSLARSR